MAHRIDFRPRFYFLPREFWDLIVIGMGGYVGGRSLEKIASAVTAIARRNAVKCLFLADKSVGLACSY